MRLKLTTLLLTLCWCGGSLFAQITVTGTVSDEDGNPLIGVNILEAKTANGTTTDLDGGYSLEVGNEEASLLFSYTGYETLEVPLSGRTSLDITLRSGVELSEIVVTGYGTARKEALTGSVTTLGSEQIENVPLASVEQSLQGNVAGLQSVMGNGQPGANVEIRIRGQGSISASSEPLFVIDGIPVVSGDLTESLETSNPLATINPNDIESVTVLKDASSTAIYGARAANGVILITTKSGKSGKPKIRLSTQVGINDWAISEDQRLRGLTAREYTDLYLEGHTNRGRSLEDAIERFERDFPDPVTGKPAVEIIPDGQGGYTLGEVRVDTRWVDEITRTGINQDHNLSMSGGNDVLTYFASGGYFKQESPIIYSQLDRFSSRLNVGVNVSPKLKISNNLNVSRTQQQGMTDGTAWANPLYNSYLLAPTIPARDPNGLFYADHKSFFMGGNNPLGSLSGDDNQEWTMIRVLDNLSADYEVLPNLVFRSSWAIDLLNFQEFDFRNSRYGNGRNDGGTGSETIKNRTNWLGTQTLTYDNSFGSNNVNFLLGYEAQRSSQREIRAFGAQFPPNANLRTLENAAIGDPSSSALSEFAFTSIFSRLSYNYDYKYYLTASLRRDGSSRFGSETRFGNFWSLGASWRLDQEPFIKNASFISQLKLRTSYGITGNAGIGNYEAQQTISFNADYDGSPAGAFNQIGNIDLTWEENASFNFGLDFGLFDGRVSGIIEYFDRESSNLLLDVPISRTTGFRTLTQNFGAMRNNGLELTLNASVLEINDFNFSIGGNITFLKNRITKLDEPFRDGTHDRFFREEGRDFNEYNVFDWAGVDPATGAPLFYTDETRTQTTSDITEATQFFIGKSGTPDFFGGFNGSLSWKGISVNALFSYSWNGYLYDATAWVLQGDGRFTPRSQTSLVLDRWQQEGDVSNVPKFSWGNRSNSNQRGSSRWIQDGTHIRLRNLTIGYQIPTSVTNKLGLSSLRAYVRGINLWTWTRDPDLYLDPEAAVNGFVNSPVPNMKTLSLGLDVGF
ncbi:MAG: TonB-dependent receptor [Bacteroidota bacterium]